MKPDGIGRAWYTWVFATLEGGTPIQLRRSIIFWDGEYTDTIDEGTNTAYTRAIVTWSTCNDYPTYDGTPSPTGKPFSIIVHPLGGWEGETRPVSGMLDGRAGWYRATDEKSNSIEIMRQKFVENVNASDAYPDRWSI